MVKPLHLADSMEALQSMSENIKTRISSLPLTSCIERMRKLQDLARKASLDRDQEEEYLFLHRYFLLLSIATKYPEFGKGSEKYKKDFTNAQTNMKRYETLLGILEKRYKEKERPEGANAKLRPDVNNKNLANPAFSKTLKDVTNNKTAGKSRHCITSKEVYSLLTSKNNKESYLIIDARSSEDFKESHLDFKNAINIPEEAITPGMSASALAKKLPIDIKVMWDRRCIVDRLIIFDWNSTEQLKPTTKLFHLREAMTKWDPSTTYRSKPLVLEGGYEDIISRYPHVTTNPKVVPPSVENLITSLSLDSFDYPIQELEPEEKKVTVNKAADGPQTAVVDRSAKPKMTGEKNVSVGSLPVGLEEDPGDVGAPPEPPGPTEVESGGNSSSGGEPSSHQEAPTTPPPSALETSGEQAASSSPQLQVSQPSLDQLRKVKPDCLVKPTPSKLRTHDEDGGVYRTALKKDDGPTTSSGILKRSSSSPNIAQMEDDATITIRTPSFSRANKPVAYGERADSTYGRTAAGLTGLKNFANNCYMNSIVQCLSNTEPLVRELISINRSLIINTQSKTKGRVAQEVISALRNMWSGDVRVYSIKDLKTLLGSLKEIFKGTGHQDSNEFLIILLEYLHDDLNIPAASENRLDGAREETGEKAWGEFRRKNCSVIQRLFYGQHRSTVTCSTCAHASVTFEQFFNLFVPLPSKEASVTLNDCIQLYMSGERISGWKCPVCREERNATKKFDISRLPPILVIALKRFTHEEDSWLQKKENLVTYPLEDLDMERFVIRSSEQRYTRYNLYAMSIHTGTLRAGHYKAICKNYITNKWYLFDDQTVEAIPVSSVRNNPEVYILFYNAVLNT